MAVKFYPHNHEYVSLDVFDTTKWVSVTTLIGRFKEEFFPKLQAQKSSKNKKSKWYKLEPSLIESVWEAEANRSTTLGTWYHNKREQALYEQGRIIHKDIEYPIYKPIELDGVKIAPIQQLLPGIYPEHFVYLKSVGVCGQSDRVDILDNKIHIRDYKTNKEIARQSFTTWEGISKKLKTPLRHLDDCHIEHYSLQFSLYAYIIKKHNPLLEVGDLILEHATFEEESKDVYGNPILRLDENKEPILKKVEEIKLPYYKREVELMLQTLTL